MIGKNRFTPVYHGMTAERIPHFVRQHLIEGRPVGEWVFAHNPLGQGAEAAED
jgi:(2Fe-2S) ferredoxin